MAVRTVGLSKAKQSLSRLVADAERGEVIILTRNGRAVAQIGPVQDVPDIETTIGWILAHQQPLADISAQALVEDGRR